MRSLVAKVMESRDSGWLMLVRAQVSQQQSGVVGSATGLVGVAA
jgi:hypothetical protein